MRGAIADRIDAIEARATLSIDQHSVVRFGVAVIGGGCIGLEAAAGLRKLGKDVVLLEALDPIPTMTSSAPNRVALSSA